MNNKTKLRWWPELRVAAGYHEPLAVEIMNVSEGILKEVGHQIASLDLSLEESQTINSVKGWSLKGFVKTVKLNDEELTIAFNKYSKESQSSRIGPYKNTIRSNVLFMILTFILALYAFDQKVETRGAPQYIYGIFLLSISLYLLFKVMRILKIKKQLTRK